MSRNKDKDAVGVTEHDENYVGVAPEYKNSAYEVNAPVASEGVEDYEDEDEVKARREVEDRVREHEANAVQPEREVKSFGDWKTERDEARKPSADDKPADDGADVAGTGDAGGDTGTGGSGDTGPGA